MTPQTGYDPQVGEPAFAVVIDDDGARMLGPTVIRRLGVMSADSDQLLYVLAESGAFTSAHRVFSTPAEAVIDRFRVIDAQKKAAIDRAIGMILDAEKLRVRNITMLARLAVTCGVELDGLGRVLLTVEP